MAVVPVAELQLGPLPVVPGIIQMMCCSVVFATVWGAMFSIQSELVLHSSKLPQIVLHCMYYYSMNVWFNSRSS